jgi:very-short-patch-repair endonuclease
MITLESSQHKKNDTSKQPFKKYNGTTVLNIENLEIQKDKVWVLWEITVPVKQPFSLLLI